MQYTEPSIITVTALLQSSNLILPTYQRPYKWTVRHVGQMLDDIVQFKEYPRYGFGTLVLHYDADKLEYNIVDGQQRTITLMLTAYALKEQNNLRDSALSEFSLPKWEFPSSISQRNIRTNFSEIARRVKHWDDDLISFFLHRCELVMLPVNDISEAFQFFDAQNSRGKPLEPHDLLKAFHLREMKNDPAVLTYVADWEGTDSARLSNLFSTFLYNIRKWAKGNRADDFNKDDIHLFKGVSLDSIAPFPFQKLSIAAYNNTLNTGFSFPFQLDQSIINGKSFFDFVAHYHRLFNSVRSEDVFDPLLRPLAARIKQTIDTYKGSRRQGDQYIRQLFNCCVAYYIDRFGYYELERAITYFFIWAYSIRLRAYAVRWSTINNAVLHEEPYLFWRIREADYPSVLFAQNLKVNISMKSSNTDEVMELFNELTMDYGR